jgi:hypothetical protein
VRLTTSPPSVGLLYKQGGLLTGIALFLLFYKFSSSGIGCVEVISDFPIDARHGNLSTVCHAYIKLHTLVHVVNYLSS